MSQLKLPEYVIPSELKDVLDKNLEIDSNMSIPCQTLIEILKALKDVDYVDLSEYLYLQLSKLALFLEEYQSSADDSKKYKLLKKTIALYNNADSGLLKINVADIIHNNNNSRPRYVHNYPQRCAHFALRLIHESNTLTYLFPLKSKSFVKDNITYYSNLKAINPTVDSNPEQKQAVLNIINKSSFPAPYILYGPPGTGKTATLVEAMCQLYRDSPSSHVLVCTPSNTAADEITRRLLKFIDSQNIYRIYSQSKDGSTIDKEIRKCSNYNTGKFVRPTSAGILNRKIVITTTCNSMRLIRMRIPKDHFSHLIIDEAGQGAEPDILIPISLISGNGKLYSQIVLAGDPQQLGPTITSKIAETILGRSILERLMSYDTYQKDCNNKYNPNYITKLLRNYRSHPDILSLSNQLFYDNELIPMIKNSDVYESFPVIFHGVKGEEEKMDSSPSSCNQEEIDMVMNYIDDLLNDRLHFGPVSAEDIGIITPFALQSQLLQSQLEDKNLKDINVGTVDLFQGQERKIMIMTTVRSRTFVHNGLEHIGFLSNSKRFNVALTRAKSLVIVIGNPNVLRIDEKWRMLMKFCKDNNSYQGLPLLPELLDDVEKGTDKVLKIVSTTRLFGEPTALLINNRRNDPEDFDDYDRYDDEPDYYEEPEDFDDYDRYDDEPDYYEEPDDFDDYDRYDDEPDYYEEPEDFDDYDRYDDEPDYYEEPEDFDDYDRYDDEPDYYEEPEDFDDYDRYDDEPDYYEEPEDFDDYDRYDDEPYHCRAYEDSDDYDRYDEEPDYYDEPDDDYDIYENEPDYYEEPDDFDDYDRYDEEPDYPQEPDDFDDYDRYDDEPDYPEEPDDFDDYDRYDDEPDYHEEPEDFHDYDRYDDEPDYQGDYEDICYNFLKQLILSPQNPTSMLRLLLELFAIR